MKKFSADLKVVMPGMTLLREKTLVNEAGDGAPLDDDSATHVLRCNRVAFQPDGTKKELTVRGQNIACTLRMVGIVTNEMQRHEASFHYPEAVNWNDLWMEKFGKDSEARESADWISLHIDGEPCYSTIDTELIDLVEDMISSVEAEEVRNRRCRFLKPLCWLRDKLTGREFVKPDIDRDSDPAIVIIDSQSELTCEFNVREKGQRTHYEVSVSRIARDKFIGDLVFFVADLMEFQYLTVLIDKARSMGKENAPAGGEGLPDEVFDGLRTRGRELLKSIGQFETSLMPKFEPERPAFLDTEV